MQLKFTLCKYLVMAMALLITTITHAVTTDISCVFETTEQFIPKAQEHTHHDDTPKPRKWFFWRTDNEIEVSNEKRNFGEKWIKTATQNVFYQALYHDKKFLLDFQPADLKILGKLTNWEMRSTLFPQSVLKQLEQKNTSKFMQYAVIHYSGIVAGIEYQVDWLPELKLPSRVEKTASNKRVITELKEIYSLNDTPYKQLTTEKYEDMDYADIGDNESHPVVSQLQKNSGVGYFHQH